MAAFGTKTLHSVGRKLKIEMQSVCGDLNIIFPAPIRNQTVTLKKGRTDPRKASLTRSDTPPSQKLQRSKSWTQDKENELIRELSKSLGEQAKQVSSSS